MSQPEHPIHGWRASIEETGPNKIEGVYGIDAHVSDGVEVLVEKLLETLANNPDLKDTDPVLIAEAVLKGLANHHFTKANIIGYLEAVKNR